MLRIWCRRNPKEGVEVRKESYTHLCFKAVLNEKSNDTDQNKYGSGKVVSAPLYAQIPSNHPKENDESYNTETDPSRQVGIVRTMTIFWQ